MSGSASSRIPAGQVVLIFALLLVVWLGFQFYPRKKPAPPLAPVAAESKLRSVGLPDNVDFEGLPELFTIWAKDLNWVENQTSFRYWNPFRKAYSYSMVAMRTSQGYRFKLIEEKNLKTIPMDVEGGNPVREYDDEQSPEHPFDFSEPSILGGSPRPPGPNLSVFDRRPAPSPSLEKVPLDLRTDAPLKITQPVVPKAEVSDGKK